ncbi:MAG TPA: DJ-1/PfpI family protein [Polyangiaceae bacterium]|nr:DJ-1/PfpI family protein [Polyangiaceae bacterium]
MQAARWIGYVLAALLTPMLVGGLRAKSFLTREEVPLVAASFAPAPRPEPHDPSKPTVAIVLGADVTEITDMVGPYEMFARTSRYNVYAVAPTAASTTLTGGLRVRPHYSFEALDGLLGGAPPAIVVAPNVPNISSAENRPVVDWVRRSADAGATSFSWCAGAAVLAEAGLLDGRTATSHWGDLARLEKEYPEVEWQRGVRWVDHGSLLTSAGITSGIDATLRLLIQREGESVARQVAAELHYANFHYALQPAAAQYSPRISDAVLFLNAAFQPMRHQIGFGLYEGVGELDVSTLYDAHAAAGVAEVHALAMQPGLVRTKHGLWLEPALISQHNADAVAALDRIIVPGRDARREGQALARAVAAAGAQTPEYLHDEHAERFSLEPVLEDLARTADVATATFARRRLEYRSSTLHPTGNLVPFATLFAALVLSLMGALLFASVAARHNFRGSATTKPKLRTSRCARTRAALEPEL